MKKILLCSVIAMTMWSCVSIKHYYAQVLQTQCANRSEKLAEADPKVVYEDNHCVVYYETWQENGNGGFGIYNKTDKILYVNLAKSFFVCNGISNQYYKARTWGVSNTSSSNITSGTSSNVILSNTNSSASASASVYGQNYGSVSPTSYYSLSNANGSSNSYGTSHTNIYSTTSSTFISSINSNSSSVSVSEMPELAIAPKSSAWISEYNIFDRLIVDCDLQRYPKESASMTFTNEDSPIHFGNYITYNLEGSDKEHIIKNEFYISKITNYAWPSLIKYVEREQKPCQNVTEDTSKKYADKYPTKVYDKYLNFDNTNCFYVLYDIVTDTKLYTFKAPLYYNTIYDGYVTNSQGYWFGKPAQ